MANEKKNDKAKKSALRVSGIGVFASMTQSAWRGESLDDEPNAAPEERRAHTTCPTCAASCDADATVCWSCGKAL